MIWLNEFKLATSGKFPGGELMVRLNDTELGQVYVSDRNSFENDLVALIRNSDELLELVMVISALREHEEHLNIKLHLQLNYLPYARQDRVCNKGEAFGLKAFAGVINSLGCNRVTLVDPHSDAAAAAINNAVVFPQWKLAKAMLEKLVRVQHYELVCPDAGAEKKVNKLAKELGSWGLTPPVYYASKVRNLANGEILATKFEGDVKGKKLVIVDDICDGGRTFIELAKVLKEKGADKVALYVTHGIFSKGMEPLKEHIDHVYANYTFNEKPSDFLTVYFDCHE